MTAPAIAANQSPLEAALSEVRATLAELLVAANEQYAAVAAQDRDRIESVTREQERLSTRLARAERQRLALLDGASLNETIAALPRPDGARLDSLRDSIADAVRDLKARQDATARLLTRSIEITQQTLNFIQRVVIAPSPVYSAQGIGMARRSMLVDSRA